MTVELLNPPSSWRNQDIVLYHGTVDEYADGIVSGGVDVSRGKLNKDFGPGFYTTTLLRQAQYWAHMLAINRRAARLPADPVVVEVTVARQGLSGLLSLGFVRGDFDARISGASSFIAVWVRRIIGRGRRAPDCMMW